MKRIFEIDPWTITSHELNAEDKRLQESITSLGNEHMGMRGMFEETYSGDTHLGVYIGGVWFPDKTRVGWWKNGYPLYFGKAINAVNFTKAKFTIDGQEVDLAKHAYQDFVVTLDMHDGVLYREFTVFGVHVTITRLISAATKELAAWRFAFQAVDGVAHQVVVDASIDADVVNEDANYDEKFWQVLDRNADQSASWMSTQTVPNDFGVPQFTVVAEQTFAGDFTQTANTSTAFAVTNSFAATVGATPVVLEKRVIVTTSRDYADNVAVVAGAHTLSQQVTARSFADIFTAHAAEWHARWEKADVQIEGDVPAQQGIRFNLFHLFATYYGNDSRLNIGPKGFTGEKYGGATYWDTEAFAIPVYLGVTKPEVVKALLKYRYDQLTGAYHNAQQQDLAGALYPMVTFDGIESHNEWEITFEEIHRNATIAYAIYNYTNLTGDHTWERGEGAEVLIGIARFWAGRVHYSKHQAAYMIHGVTGPNEYENNVNNNFYTNWMAKWVLSYATDVLPKIDDQIAAKLAVTDEEVAHWQDIIAKMWLPEVDTTDVDGNPRHIFLAQDGWLDKDLVPVRDLPADELPINQHWSWDRVLRSPYIKQSDTLHAMYYFPDAFTEEQKRDNYLFYEPFTVHESSLSPSVHSIIAADLKMEDKAVEFYERTARLDLDNYNNDTNDGLHITSMTGAWLSIVQGFAGMRVRDDQLVLNPFLPKKWTSYQFRLIYRGRILEIKVAAEDSTVKLIDGEPLIILLNGIETEVK
ncbi:glycoside hydrolase family 65 protein [Weissella soli]|uniref:glycoside hydrolase family 65 protein n=1 Tax=Weissella soli TaxID=155866 RepID=UPI0021C0921D|nr:glycoside hydrolase family 65 protein [Weissella soli]MCT8395031.1 glycoside hydrolase family 65 protein [Weissella soli]